MPSQDDKIAAVKEKLKGRIVDLNGIGCFVCSWILRDLEKNDRLTSTERDLNGQIGFPKESKLRHIILEGIYEPSSLPGNGAS